LGWLPQCHFLAQNLESEAVVSLSHDQWEVFGDCIENHNPTYEGFIPKKEEGSEKNGYPVDQFSAAGLQYKLV